MAGAEYVSTRTGAKYTIKGVVKQGDQPITGDPLEPSPLGDLSHFSLSNIKAAGFVAVLKTWY